MKLKNIAGAFLALAGIAFCGTAGAVEGGNIFEFRPITPVNTAATAFGAAEKIQFKMRLISPDPKATPESSRPLMQIYYKADYDENGYFITPPNPYSHMLAVSNAWARTPLQLGIVVSGQVRGCDLSDPVAIQSRQFFDMTCTYVTKFGDLALPVRLAIENKEYVFINNAIWGIGWEDATGRIHEINPTYFTGEETVPRPDMDRNGSLDLMWGFGGEESADRAYFIRTVGFDSKSVTDEDGTWWRTVNEGRTTYKPDVPAIVIDDVPEKPEDLYVYVWSEDDWIGNEANAAVTMKVTDDEAVLKSKYGVEKMTFLDTNRVERTFWVKRIRIDGNNAEYAFDMKGLNRGKSTTVVLKGEPGYTFHEFEHEHALIVDYLSAKVKCSDPLPPTVMVKVTPEDTVSVRPMTDVQTRVATLTVELSDPYPDGDVTVDVGPFLAVNGVAGESATNYFGISEKTETMSYLDKVPGVTFSRSEMMNGQLTKTLYVYAWGADAKTYAVDKAVAFVPSIEDETVRAFFVGGFEQALLKVKPIKPEIVEPVEGKLIEVNCSVPYSLRIVVNDTYNDMRSTNGFEVLVKHDITQDDSPAPYNDGFVSLGRFAPDADGVLYSIPTGRTDTAKLPQVTWENTATEHAAIYLRSPESKEKSEERTIDLVVKPARQIDVRATDGREGNQYIEGEDVSVDIELLNAKNDTGDTIYAFLVPQGEATNAVSATWLAAPGCTGRPITKNGYLASGLFTLLDGTKESKRGATYDFKVELRTKQSYSAGVPVPGFESLTLTIFSMNVIPSVDFVEMNNGADQVYENGGTFSLVVPEGVTNWFQAFVTEPGEYDRTTGVEGKRFETRWRVTDPSMGVETFSVFGDPDTNKFGYAFTAGKAKVEIDLKDKDMTRYGNGEENKKFTFFVEVISNPSILIGTTKGSNQFDETESEDAGGEAALTVDLTLNQVRDPLVVELTLTPPGGPNDNPGKIVLQTNSTDCVQTSPGVYQLTFGRGVKTKTIGVKTLDGTPLSRTTGFKAEAKVLGAMKNGVLDPTYPYPGVPGKTCSGYYVGIPTVLKVSNVAPQVDIADLYPQPGSTNKCAIGQADAISWNFTDVLPDFTDNGEIGITVTVKGGGGYTTNVTTAVGAAGSFAPTFTQSGLNTVTLTIKDKDNGSVSFMWYYEVEVSKKLLATPHGPTGGKGGANATRYSTAPGLGEGHVYGGEPSAVSGFESTYNCQLAKRWTVWAFGYKVGTYDDGTLDGGKDFALSPSGALIESGLPDKSSYYKYPTYLDKNGNPADSFRYTWLQILSGEDQAGFSDEILNSAFSPEQAALAADAGQPVALPTELLDDKTYDDAMLEAIFSVEYLASDNMGDINQDRIPDLYVNRYGLGVVDTVTKLVAGDDLKAITLANNGNTDEDFLPGDPTAFAGYVSGLSTLPKAFTADYEIRGFGEALNDAPIQIGLKGVKPDRVYEDPDLSPTSTLTKVEFLAWSEFKTAYEAKNGEGTATVEMWSPERPTDPMEPDTDDDGFTDGYEYYFWYLAHVGWIDANGVHRRLTGRAYDERNPGEGRFIPSEEIAARMDPQVKYTGSDAEERDTDNDGLPDKLEFEIGTNPFDFDSDGDGLPDGWELCYTSNLDPTDPISLSDGKNDAERNYDGDAMAFTTVALEENVLPKPRFIQRYNTFATVDADGDTDGIQWYAETPLDGGVSAFAFAFDEAASRGTVFRIGGVDYVTTRPFAVTADSRLAVTLTEDTYVVTNASEAAAALKLEAPEGVKYVRLRPVKLVAGAVVETNEADVAFAIARVAANAAPEKCNAAWVYGNANVLGGKFGMLALARYQLPEEGDAVAELPTAKRDVAYLHYLVYQQFGFDPRTAWNENTPLAARWGKTGDVDSSAGQVSKKGYADQSTRTRAYTAYDEFLLYSFFLNNGCDMGGYLAKSATAKEIINLWGAFTTNPQGPNEPPPKVGTRADVADVEYLARGTNGADTDDDGVPDGWELYIMAGPKIGKDGKADPKDGKFNFAPAYTKFRAAGEEVIDMLESYFSPFVKAATIGTTDNMAYIGKDQNDSLNEYQEFAGTDSCGYYEKVQSGNTVPYSTTVKLPEGWTWLNKFFPTDPWVPDTDDDGVKDNEEGGVFAYAKDAVPEDDGKSTCFAGCGLNPCSVDTDGDGIPDGWEKQFAGSTVSTNAVEGYIDGMDGTVKDAVTVPRKGPNRDYDHDGLENWQEYLTGTMRCWRYDDPFTQWGAIPFDAYFDVSSETGVVNFSPNFEMLFGYFPEEERKSLRSMDEEQRWNWFWYQTLVNIGGPIYNPHLVTDQSPTAQYFSRVDVGWDPNYWDSVLAGTDDPDKGVCGRYYWFAHRIGRTKYKEAWTKFYGSDYAPTLYVSCSPRSEDSDHDGMDDFYELFHGLNPLLGGDGMTAFEDPADIVKCIKGADQGGPVSFNYNPWVSPWPVGLMMQPPMRPAREVCDNPDFDFIVHPWKNGLQTADPDGDNERNYVEAILAKTVFGMHTDPSPAWMTDASYADSLTRLCYRVPRVNYFIPFKFGMVNDQVKDQNGDSVPGFTWGGVKYYFRDFDAYDMKSEGKSLEFFSPDAWAVSGDLLDARTPEYLLTSDRVTLGGWMFSFEENEGYDTDHDAMGDEEEIAGRIRSATDPLDFDSPRRRQAMYFPGKDSALQTPPEMIEEHPIVGSWYKQDPSFAHYTVECWARPEEIRNATVVERAIWSDGSNGGDANLVRKNFLIGTRVGEDGKCYWFTKFDSNGTGSEKKDEVSVRSGTPAEIGVWTHVAATYDGEHIVLYVNGQQSGTPADPWRTRPLPECAVAEVLTYRAQPVAGQLETIVRYSHHAIVVGASVKSYDDYDVDFTDQVCGYAVNLYNAMGWSYYKDFFKGYVDEIRIWDGARKQEEIQGSMRTRFDSEKAKENRSATYKALNLRNWAGRYEKGEDGTVEEMPAELRYHFSFDALPSAANAEYLAVVPQGFANGDKAPVSRPEGYEIAWWKRILDSYGSAYAGVANFVNWIPNTVAHLPRFDGTTYDSAFWSDDYKGDLAEVNRFAHTAEPYPLWKQVLIGRYTGDLCSTLSRWYLANVAGTNSDLSAMFDFTGRHLLCEGADLLPLGGAYARYVDTMWDGQGASSMRELTGEDNDNDGLPDWWQVYANQNYHRDVPEEEDITWDTLVWYEVGGVEIRITAAEAYKRDLAKGAYVDESGVVHPTADERAAGTVLPYVQTAKSDSMIPDWWKELKKIDSEDPLADLDRDGLNNYVEYVASELLPFRLNLDPRMAFSDSKTLDYFRKVGRLYLGEMLTDHDQMEDHWERSLGDENVASAAIWDALRDGEEDGWTNFAENRYNGYSMSTLAQLVAHAMGDNEVLDAPTPSIKMKVRYNGGRPLAAASSDGGNDSKGTSDAVPSLVVRAYSKNAETGDYAMNPDATWTVTPGVETEERSFYLGAWEDRIVRGTLAPGNVNLDSVDIKFAQVPQNDLYSWSDESGLHLAKSYKEFKEAFDKNPNIIQNIQSFQWLSLVAPANEYTSSDKAVTVGRDNQSQQNAPIAVYGEPVGSIDLTTGDFEFDLGAMNKLRVNYTFDGAKGSAAAWSYKEAIFKITYTAKVPSAQQKVVDFSLAKADKGFVRGGLNSIEVFYDSVNANGTWDPGEPFGVVNDVEIGWAGRDVEIELTDMSAVTPRVKLWGESGGEGGNAGGGNVGGEAEGVTASAADSDRGMRVGTDWTTELPITMELMGKDASGRPLPRRVATNAYDRLNRLSAAPGEKVNVKVVRYMVDNFMAYRAGAPSTVIMEKTFEHTSRDFLHEGDFLADGELDIDWSTLSNEVVTASGVQSAGCEVTNVTYLVAFNWGPTAFRTDSDTNTVVSAFSTLVTRRFEVERTVPTPVQDKSTVTVFNKSRPTFTWKIEDEDEWAAWFGTTYTAFKVRVKGLDGKLVYDSGVRRLPAKDSEGKYSWTAPLYVGEVVPGTGMTFANFADYTWEVAVYNAKFSTDDLMTMKTKGNPFSSPRTFRMNVTGQDASSRALATRVCYAGPATWLEGLIHVQAFESPDFTGDPVAAVTLGDVSAEALSPADKTANAKLIGLPEGKYFLRAYIDTNTNGVHDAWESWGYLNERDLASKPGIFNPVAAEATLNPDEANVRTVLIEDCDTDGDWFPDVWEAEQNGGVFDPEVVKPVTGNAELIGVNPELKKVLNASDGFPMLETLASADGFALLTGFNPAQVRTTVAANGTSRFSVDNKVDSVTISSLDFDADGNVVIRLDAKTTVGSVDPVATAVYDLDLSKTVTCRIYRKTNLASAGWGNPVAEETVTVGAGPVTIPVDGEKSAQAFYRAEIIEK